MEARAEGTRPFFSCPVKAGRTAWHCAWPVCRSWCRGEVSCVIKERALSGGRGVGRDARRAAQSKTVPNTSPAASTTCCCLPVGLW